MDEAEAGPGELEPLTLRQKVANKRYNRGLDAVVTPFKAAGLGVLGYGAIKPAIDAANGEPFPIPTFVLSLVVALVISGGAIYVQTALTRRED